MSGTLKLFKKAPQETWKADAAPILEAEPVISETTALHHRQILQDNSKKTDRFIRSNN
jgi:hypothetical protein